MTTTSTEPANLVDPATGEKVWAHAVTGRHYVPQGFRKYLLGRALDFVIVAAVAVAIMAVTSSALGSSPEWATALALAVVLLTVIFLYGAIAGTIGSIGDTVTGMRTVRTDDGVVPGFRAGGVRAIGWFFAALFMLALSDTGGSLETRYVSVRRSAGVYRGELPVLPKLPDAAHT